MGKIMITIKLNNAVLSLDKQGDAITMVYDLMQSQITFELIAGEIKLLLDWCESFPNDFGVYACFGAVKFTENSNGMPLVLIDKDGYKARINLTKRNLGQISEYIRGVK